MAGMPRACVLLAEGFEEIEAVTVIDMLRRAEVETVVAGVTGRQIRGSHAITLLADLLMAQAQEESWDVIYLPGGLPGAENLRDDPRVQELVKKQIAAGGRVAAICAGPIALEAAGVLEGRRATSYPGFGEQLSSLAEYVEERVVVDGKVITSRGPGTAAELALELVEQLRGPEQARALRERMLWR